MRRFLALFVLTQPEQRLIIVLILLLVAGAWYQHHRDVYAIKPAPTASPAPNEH